MISMLTFSNADEILHIADTYTLDRVKHFYTNKVLTNFDGFSRTEQFLQLPAKQLARQVRLLCVLRPSVHDHTLFLPPATKLGQGYVFTCVCDSVNRGQGVPHTSPEQTPPGVEAPPEQTPPSPLAQTHPPPRRAWCEIWSMRGWYASYWNAILLAALLLKQSAAYLVCYVCVCM